MRTALYLLPLFIPILVAGQSSNIEVELPEVLLAETVVASVDSVFSNMHSKQLYDSEGLLLFSKDPIETWLRDPDTTRIKWNIYLNESRQFEPDILFSTCQYHQINDTLSYKIFQHISDEYAASSRAQGAIFYSDDVVWIYPQNYLDYNISFIDSVYSKEQIESFLYSESRGIYEEEYERLKNGGRLSSLDLFAGHSVIYNDGKLFGFPFIQALPDSVYSNALELANRTGRIYLIQNSKLIKSEEELDAEGNWITRKNKFHNEITERRTIRYAKDYRPNEYQELICDSLIHNNKIVRERDIYEELGGEQNYELSSYFGRIVFGQNYIFALKEGTKVCDYVLERQLLKNYKIAIWDKNSSRYYEGSLSSERKWYDRDAYFYRDTFNELIKTGIKESVNGFLCDEYLYKSDYKSGEIYYYVTEELPFIPSPLTVFELPGLAMKTKSTVNGDTTFYKLRVNNIRYPYEYLEFLDYIKDKNSLEFDYIRRK